MARTDTLVFESPAQATARRINESLRTDEFVREVRTAAGVPADSLIVTVADVRESVWASAEGQNLLTVNASTLDPQLAQRLVQSTIDTFLQAVVDDQIRDSTVTKNYSSNRRGYRERVRPSNRCTLRLHPRAPEPLRQSAAHSRSSSRSTVSIATSPVPTSVCLTRSTTSRRPAPYRAGDERCNADVERCRPAVAPVIPTAGLRDTVMTVGTFGVLGMMLLVGGVVAASLLDRSLRFAEEIRSSLGVEVLAVVPVESRGQERHRRGAPS